MMAIERRCDLASADGLFLLGFVVSLMLLLFVINFFAPPSFLNSCLCSLVCKAANDSSELVKWHQNIPLGNLPWEKVRILSLALAFLQDSSHFLQYWPYIWHCGDCRLAVMLPASRVRCVLEDMPRKESQVDCVEDAPAMT